MKRSNIWTIKILFSLLCMTLGTSGLMGQDNEGAKKKMIEIKLNEDFIFGEGMSDDRELAYGDALDDLLIFANELKSMNSQEAIKINDLITNVETIVYQDGSRYEVLVYIPFKIVIDTNAGQSSSAKEEIKQQKEVAKPEEKKANPVSVSIDKTSGFFNKTDLSAKNDEAKAQNDAVKKQEAKEEAPKAEPEKTAPKPSGPKPSEKKEPQAVTPPANNNPVLPESGSEVEEFLITQENFSEIKQYMSEMKRAGKIKETGAAENISAVPQDASLILIDGLGGILSVLSPAGEGGRINYKTKKSDSENNYNSKFIVWYRK